LKRLIAGDVDYAQAERLVRSARRRIATIDKLLRRLGQTDDKALASRFRDLTKRMERGQPDPKTAQLFGKLTVAFHKLNQLLQQHFYSPPS
jgi:chromosome condensin MukBEF ATPase and DNA-binding subunit MukB